MRMQDLKMNLNQGSLNINHYGIKNSKCIETSAEAQEPWNLPRLNLDHVLLAARF